MICEECNDTGKRKGSDYIDCTACDCAKERMQLEEFSAYMPIITSISDEIWLVHQRARQIEREAQAARIAELETRLEIGPGIPYDGIHRRDVAISELDKELDEKKRHIQTLQLVIAEYAIDIGNVRDALQEICDMQINNYGNNIKTHLALAVLADKARHTLKYSIRAPAQQDADKEQA